LLHHDSVGNLRFAKPVANNPYNGTVTATAYGLACPQQSVTLPLISGLPADAVDFIINSVYGVVFPDSEDCLTINVYAAVHSGCLDRV
jgi:acetylcholinesterase